MRSALILGFADKLSDSRLTEASSLGGAFWKVLVTVFGDGFLAFCRYYLFCQQKNKKHLVNFLSYECLRLIRVERNLFT